MSTEEMLSQQDSFNKGVSAALMALKTALIASPGFNNEALTHVVTVLLKYPMEKVHHEAFSEPVRALLNDHVINSDGSINPKGESPS